MSLHHNRKKNNALTDSFCSYIPPILSTARGDSTAPNWIHMMVLGIYTVDFAADGGGLADVLLILWHFPCSPKLLNHVMVMVAVMVLRMYYCFVRDHWTLSYRCASGSLSLPSLLPLSLLVTPFSVVITGTRYQFLYRHNYNDDDDITRNWTDCWTQYFWRMKMCNVGIDLKSMLPVTSVSIMNWLRMHLTGMFVWYEIVAWWNHALRLSGLLLTLVGCVERHLPKWVV